VIFFNVVDSYYQDIFYGTNDAIIGTLVCDWSFFFSLLSLHKLQGGERKKEKKKKITLETHRNFNYDTTCTIKKIYLNKPKPIKDITC
jgi:hypothetical protein